MRRKGFFDVPPSWTTHWRGMPDFVQEDQESWRSVRVHFRCEEDQQAFAKLVGQKMSPRTRSLWYPKAEIGRIRDKRYESGKKLKSRYPVYIPSKGRWESRLTVRAFERIGMPYRIVVEKQEYRKYAGKIDPDNILVLPFRDRGLVAARNWIWDHAAAAGARRFWTFDDNITGFYRLHHNLKVPVSDCAIFRIIEDFVERYENVPIAGCNYFMFAPRKSAAIEPFTLNTRVYSNMLILTDARDPKGEVYRNEGFFNDDTDLCLRVLKDGWCTVLFNAFLCKKMPTMKLEGGMTGYYQGDGRYKMAKELADKHPDIVKITKKWGRYQHQVDYSRFVRNRLRLRPGVVLPDEKDDYGMSLRILEDEE